MTKRLAGVWLLVACSALIVGAADRPRAQSSLQSQHWLTTAGFPEAQRLAQRRPVDLAIAFSGGGTRSAAATLGQLRALRELEWLERVRYITAASGGAWGAVPYAFSTRPAADLLGVSDRPECLPQLPPGHGESIKPCGLLADAIANSSLILCGLRAYLSELVSSDSLNLALKLINQGCNNAGRDTYSTLIGRIFLPDSVCPNCAGQPFTWDEDSKTEIRENGGPADKFTTQPENRPFVMMPGTLIIANANWSYPHLAQVEITPYYAGIRAQHGANIGGSYVASWAYGAFPTSKIVDGRVAVADRGPLTLEEALGITGSAPLLSAYVIPQLARARAAIAGLFPRLSVWAGRNGSPSPVSGDMSHGDGGFLDNLALMPLLARKARNIIVFINGTDDFRISEDVEQYFTALDSRKYNADRTHSAVFGREHFVDIQRQFVERTAEGKAPIACSDPTSPWSVKENAYFGVEAYDELNICWVYTELATNWVKDSTIPETLRVTLPLAPKLPAPFCDQYNARGKRKDKRPILPESLEARQALACEQFKRLPWYHTFEESFNLRTFNVEPIKLSLSQVNMLSAFTAWSVRDGQERIRTALPVLKP